MNKRIEQMEDDAQILLGMLRVCDDVPEEKPQRWTGPRSLSGFIAKGLLDELLIRDPGTYITIPEPSAAVLKAVRSHLSRAIRKFRPGWTASVYKADGDRVACVLVPDMDYQRMRRDGTYGVREVPA